VCATASEIESEAPEIRQKFLLNHVTQMIKTGRTTLKLASAASVVVCAQHVNTLPEPSDRGFDGAAHGKRRSQFRYRPAHVSVGIVPELICRMGNTREYRVNMA
jgi:hypothetical protein